jgi:hypothetical protein
MNISPPHSNAIPRSFRVSRNQDGALEVDGQVVSNDERLDQGGRLSYAGRSISLDPVQYWLVFMLLNGDSVEVYPLHS